MKPQFARCVVTVLGFGLILVAPPARSPAGGPAAVTPAAAAPAVAAAACPPGVLVCTKLKVEGTSRIAKLGSDIVLVPGEFIAKAFFENLDPNWPLRIEGDLTLPTVRGAYLVVLRFMPSTNDVDFIPDGKVTGRGRIIQPPDQPPGLYVEADLVAKLFVRLSNVKQDGIDLKVGDNCRTEIPAAIPLRAVLRLEVGATATTQATFGLPRFARCGTTENLDPLLSGLVSGPGNVLRSLLTVTAIGEV